VVLHIDADGEHVVGGQGSQREAVETVARPAVCELPVAQPGDVG
jgi:hypothetical protein